jgi:hypothetical protein
MVWVGGIFMEQSAVRARRSVASVSRGWHILDATTTALAYLSESCVSKSSKSLLIYEHRRAKRWTAPLHLHHMELASAGP